MGASLLASAGISYTNRSYPGDKAVIAVGVQQIEVPDGRGLDAAGLKSLKEKVGGDGTQSNGWYIVGAAIVFVSPLKPPDLNPRAKRA